MQWTDQWWYQVPELIKRTDEFYTRNVLKSPSADKITITTKKIVEVREWTRSLIYIEDNFPQVLKDLNIFYVPKTYIPGPLVVFPILNLDGEYLRAQTHPGFGSVLADQGKYYWIGEKIVGPNWLGNDPETIKRIIETRRVSLVEGPYDLLACRLLCPEIPTMSPLTKSINEKHEAYLRMLGVDTLNLMFDNEEPDREKGKDIGAGNLSMKILQKKIKTMDVVIRTLKGSDPSAALKSEKGAERLRELLLNQ